MDQLGFIKNTVLNLPEQLFTELRCRLCYEYIPFSFLTESDITPAILIEKLNDHLEKVSLKTGKTFDKLIEAFVDDIDAIVSEKIAKQRPSKEKGAPPIKPRTRKYYEKALGLKKDCGTDGALLDYARIMLCLFMATIANAQGPIDKFNYDADCLELPKILATMREEKTDVFVGIGQKKRFDLEDTVGRDNATFIFTILMYYRIMANTVTGGQ